MTTSEYLALQQKTWAEKDFQDHIINLARANQWRVAHFRAVKVQRADGSVRYETPVQADGKGFPDLVLVRDRVLFVEVKRENGILEPAQKDWMKALLGAKAEHMTWRPSDLENIRNILCAKPRWPLLEGKGTAQVYREGIAQ